MAPACQRCFRAGRGLPPDKARETYIRDSGLLHALLGLRAPAEVRSHPRSGASWEGFALEHAIWALGAEVPMRMKQERHEAGIEVRPAQIGSLVQIAFWPGTRGVGDVISAAVSPRDNVPDVEPKQGSALWQMAVFTSLPRPLANEVAGDA